MKDLPSQDSLESSLRRDAARLPLPAAPAGLERRIAALIAADRGESRESIEPGWFSARWGWAALAAGTALVAAALGARVWLVHPNPEGPAPASDRIDSAQLAQSVKAFPAQLLDRVRPGAAHLLAQDPLRQEATDLYSDARAAAGFLAMNFLPTAPAPRARANAPGRG